MILGVVLALVALSCAAPPAPPMPPQTPGGLALNGVDVVAFRSLKAADAAVLGVSAFNATWRQMHYHFASAANRDQFAAAPLAFVPKYGGY